MDDEALKLAVNEMEEGLYEASLGGNVFKKRVPLGSRGKSGGARTIVAVKMKDKSIFLYGFAKNQKGNISKKEKESLKALAKTYLSYDNKQINQAIKLGILIEVK